MLKFFRNSNKLAMSEALGILGLAQKSGPAEIKKAYIAKMRKHHPDLGGDSNYAAQLNWAREVLLK